MTKKDEDLFSDDAEPEDLPEAKQIEGVEDGQLIPDKARFCPKCGQEGRVVSNFLGRQAYCGPCKYDWAIGPPVQFVGLPTQGRGLSKRTVVQPNWDLVNEDIDPTGPK